VDVSSLELGDSLHVRDLALPEGVELKTDSDLSVISIVAPSVAEEPVAEAAEEEELVEGAVPDAPQEKEAGAAPEGDESKKE
jgi:large subunit ribosomal protein L25